MKPTLSASPVAVRRWQAGDHANEAELFAGYHEDGPALDATRGGIGA